MASARPPTPTTHSTDRPTPIRRRLSRAGSAGNSDTLPLSRAGLATVDGPWTDDILTYAYDWQNRRSGTDVVNDALSVASWTESMTYDSLGRVASIDNLIGQFLPSYVGNGGRLASVAAPHGVTVDYDYYPVTETGNKALRLKQIANKVNGNAVSTFDYDYDYDGRISQWGQTLGAPKKTWNLGYDRASQLTSAIQTDASSTVLERRSWQYDLAGNRTIENLGSGSSNPPTGSVIPAAYNNLNQLMQTGGAGETVVEGTIDEPGSVTVNSQPAAMNNVPGTDDWRFRKKIPVVAGENTVTVAATDESNNTRTETYAFDVGPQDLVFGYDGNGNMLTDGVRTFTWDAQNRLTSVTIGTDTWEWDYDGLSRRVREWHNGTLTKQWIWDGLRLIQQRDATGAVTRNWQTGGSTQDASGTQLAMVHTYDHLGSIREAIDSTGTIRARYDYALWGDRTKLTGDLEIEPGFTGHYEDAAVGLTSAPFRAYDAELGRWISRDPIESLTGHRAEVLPEGPNLYAYASNEPLSSADLLGLECLTDGKTALGDFIQQYWNMRQANFKNSDKYFHCMANCLAATRGGIDDFDSKLWSNLREWIDEHIKGDSKEACEADQKANKHGREAGREKKNCKEACSKYRPKGLPSEY